jgi:dihydrofolate reductase
MRKLFITEFISLDGVVEAPGGEPDYPHSGWVFAAGDDHGPFKAKETMEDTDALLLGRKTYEGFAAAWPERDGEFADKFNNMPKYVVSTTLSEPLAWNNSTLIPGDNVVEEIKKLKEGEGGPISVHGSITLAQTLIANDLVDQLNLMIFPVVLGANGKRLFDDNFPGKLDLKLADTEVFANGVVVHVYERP